MIIRLKGQNEWISKYDFDTDEFLTTTNENDADDFNAEEALCVINNQRVLNEFDFIGQRPRKPR